MAKKAKQEEAAPASMGQVKLGEKPYKPGTPKNAKSWEKLQRKLAKGPVSYEDALKVLVYEEGEEKISHTNFLGYMIRGKHIDLVK